MLNFITSKLVHWFRNVRCSFNYHTIAGHDEHEISTYQRLRCTNCDSLIMMDSSGKWKKCTP